MSDLVAFLLARLDEDEQAARTLDQMPRWVMEHDLPNALPGVAQHIARHDPARVLAEVAALRAIVDWSAEYADASPNEQLLLGRTQCQLAGIWADHPDYDPAWKVET